MAIINLTNEILVENQIHETIDESNEKLLTAKENAVIAEVAKETKPRRSISTALDFHGASIDDMARTVAAVMSYGSSDTSRLRAVELAANLHGIYQKQEAVENQAIIFNISGLDGNINFLTPRRM